MFRHLHAAAVVAALSAFALAQAPTASTFHGARYTAEASAQETAEDSVTGTFGVDFATGYYFRGFQYENQGLICQPHLELDFTLTSGGEDLRSVDLILGVWNSLHSGPTGTESGNGAWYEGDFYWGLGVGFGERWSASATYAYYASPNGAFATTEELVLGLSYDDSAEWAEGASGLQPTLTLAFETKGQTDGGAELGTYVQLSVEPSFALGQTGDFDWTVAVPVAIGFSLENYYEDAGGDDNPFGFVDVGAALSSPVPVIPGRFGPWTMTLSLHAMFLGDTPEDWNQGDHFQLVGSFGLSTAF